MIDEKYKIERFTELSVGSVESVALHKSLQDEIAAQMHRVCSAAFRKIIGNLNSLGHNLEESYPECDLEFNSYSYEALDKSNETKPRIWYESQVGVMSGYDKIE